MSKHVTSSLLLFVLSLVICCAAYPLVMLAIGWTVFPDKVEGSLIRQKGADGTERVVGSRQIAQVFTKDQYFWPRPSAVSYNAAAAGGSNWGANQPKLRDRAAQQLGTLIRYRTTSRFFTGPEPEKAVQNDIRTWFAAKPNRAEDWAGEYSVAATGWARTDLARDKYGLQGEYILEWAKTHPEVTADWKKANPDKEEGPKPEDVVAPFFASFARAHPGQWPAVVGEGDKKHIEPAAADDGVAALFFDMWLQDPANAAQVADLEPVPADMVTASGAGLDPHITVRNALSVYQLERVAKARAGERGDFAKLRGDIEKLVNDLAFTPLAGLVGEPLVNVLELNVALDDKFPMPTSKGP